MNKNENVVVALFADGPSADKAIENLREWDKRVDEVKLGSIGRINAAGGRVETKIIHAGLFHRSLPISDEALATLANELSGGQVAVAVAVDDYEATMVRDSLVRDGGKLVANTSVHTSEERTAEQKAIEEAKLEADVRAISEKNTRPSTYNVSKPM